MPFAKGHKIRCSKPREGGNVSHTIRTRDGGTLTMRYSRKMAILLCCTECLGWEQDPKDCTSLMCPLWPFRGVTRASNKAGKA